ncbi:MAG: hypothetical protein SFZ23_13140 [Planctomycetota bacterium]|nr:hypothetical protein [Planctomycetota bacterium]
MFGTSGIARAESESRLAGGNEPRFGRALQGWAGLAGRAGLGKWNFRFAPRASAGDRQALCA